jgi:hypothetical protein
METPTHRSVRTLAAAATLALAGCSTARILTLPAGAAEVAITFGKAGDGQGPCPLTVTVREDSQCEDTSTKAKRTDCLRTTRGATVRFQADLPGAQAGTKDLEFSLDFDPFTKGSNKFKAKNGQALELKLDPSAPPKTYVYNVFSGTCPVVDPQIIIRD